MIRYSIFIYSFLNGIDSCNGSQTLGTFTTFRKDWVQTLFPDKRIKFNFGWDYWIKLALSSCLDEIDLSGLRIK